jgi:arylsulfatase A-like enzyme
VDALNIIYLHSHDTGRYIEPYGFTVPTPNLMQFAREGVLFRHAYNAGPTCSPSRAALMTGTAPHTNGMLGLTHRGFGLYHPEWHLAHYLRENGYETVLSGVQHEARLPEELGYQLFLTKDDKGSRTDKDRNSALKAAEYITNHDGKKPFFLAVGFNFPHREFLPAADDINPDYVQPPHPFHDNPDNRRDMAEYMTSARYMDECAGIVLDSLRNSPHADNTIIMYTTDHGIAFPRMKCNLYDTGLGVSLILKVPGLTNSGQTLDGLVSQIDIYPTLCELARLEKPDWLQGRSIVPLLAGETDRVRDEIFSEVSYHAAYEPMRCVRTERYKLIRFYDDHRHQVLANIDDGLSKQFMLDHGFAEEARVEEQLFDLYLDPVERVNQINNPAYADVYASLSDKLAAWMEQTGDPLLHGPVPRPKGAKVNTVTSVSPRSKELTNN